MFNRNNGLTDAQIDAKAQDLLGKMTLKEKVWLLNGNWDPIANAIRYKVMYNPRPIKTTGNKRLGIQPIAFSDGPRGIVMGHSTSFPVSMARAATFDTNMERRVGNAIGIEARAGGANYFAGVCINVLVNPAGGRAQESYGEDPHMLGEMGKALLQSVQEHGVMACVKHYALNNIENTRFHVDVDCDERTLHEVYLPHFKKCVDAGAASIMGSYNKFRGDHVCENRYLLTKVLREDWGFQGFTSADFIFGIRDTKKAIESGMDVEMPLPIHYKKQLLKMVKAGEVSEEYVNQSVLRILRTQIAFEQPDKMKYSADKIACKSHTDLAREVAEKSAVLIKNQDGVLPFRKKGIKRILVAGKLANEKNTGDHGSSMTYAPYIVSPLEGIKNYFSGQDVEIIYCKEDELELAKQAARTADAVVIVAGNDYNDEGEGVMPDSDTNPSALMKKGFLQQNKYLKALLVSVATNKMNQSYTSADDTPVGGDRKSLSLKKQEIKMIQEIGSINKNTVVSLVCGSMIMVKEWEDCVPAIMYNWYSGMEGGNALPRILFGDVNPCGKLPFTVPSDESHLHPFDSKAAKVYYDYYHGYRKLDKENHTPSYPYGFGLSYTTYEYSEVSAEQNGKAVSVKVKVKNTGKRAGDEAVQVYVSVKGSAVERFVKELKSFQKVHLEPGESKEVTLTIPNDELRYYDVATSSWILEDAEYVFLAGPSSADKDLLRCKSIRLG